MKKLILIFCVTILSQYDTFAQTKFELNPSQSMSITGKGIGQDAAKNPFDGQNCFAIVENIGKRQFSIRTQKNGEIIESILINAGETKKVKLLLGYELYFDTNDKGKAKATVDFEKITK
jgi:hypothetical protein